MTTIRIRRASQEIEQAVYVRHLRTLAYGMGRGNVDLDLYRLADGTEIVCECADSARAVPMEWEGLTEQQALFVEV